MTRPKERSGDRHRMAQGDGHASKRSLRLMKQPELAHYCTPVVVDALAGESILGIEREDTAQREVQSPAGCGQPASPDPEVSSPNGNLENDRIGCNVPFAYVDREIGQGRQELGVVRTYRVEPKTVVPPWLVVGRRWWFACAPTEDRAA